MNMQLAYRLATMPVMTTAAVSQNVDAPLFGKQIAAEVKMIASAKKVLLDNVATYYMDHERHEWDIRYDVPNFAPVFTRTWAEWKEDDGGCRTGQAGILAISMRLTDEIKRQHTTADFNRILGLFSGYDCDLVSADNETEPLHQWVEQAGFITMCSHYGSASCEPLKGRPVWLGLRSLLFIDPGGRLIRSPVHVGIESFGIGRSAGVHSSLCIYGLGLSFMHCKNVISSEAAMPRSSKWHKQHKVPTLKFYSLNIEPMKTVLRHDGRSDEVGLRRALHICRGHFATYSSERPLFGKITGTFWKPDHTRGHLSSGAIIKDYVPLARSDV